jgi:O-antigen ligase
VAGLAILRRTASARLLHVPGVSGGALVIAGALPLLLLHRDYQHLFAIEAGGTAIDVKLSDLALLVVAGTALAAALRRPGVLRTAAPVLLPAACFVALAFAGVAVGAASERPYAAAAHLVTAAGWAEYSLLALAFPLLARDLTSFRLLLWALVAWLGFLAAVALLQFAGLDWETTSRPGSRQPSLIGFQDLGAAGGAAFVLGLTALALGHRWRLGRVGAAAGGVGGVAAVLSGSVAAAAGIVGAAALVAAVGYRARTLVRRRGLWLGAATLAVVVGIVLLRAGDIGQLARFIGLLPKQRTSIEDVQTYSHRTLLAYLGLRVYADNPVVGAGWHASNEYRTLEPYLPDARRRFPDLAEEAFPTRDRPFGVQNAYVQALADLGVVGLLVFAAALAVPVAVGARAAARGVGPPELLLGGAAVVTVCAGVWTAEGLVAATPLLALACLGMGLVAAGRSRVHG